MMNVNNPTSIINDFALDKRQKRRLFHENLIQQPKADTNGILLYFTDDDLIQWGIYTDTSYGQNH